LSLIYFFAKAILGVVAAPVWSFRHFVEEFLWIWLHLLQFTTSNQSCSLTAVVEDADNKPDRPIPAGRMTLRQTRILRWSLVPFCLAVSYMFSTSVLAASVAVIAITCWYNELGGSGNHWFTRNLLNGIGFGAFETGATLLAGRFQLTFFSPFALLTRNSQGRDRSEFDIVAARAIIVSIWIYSTTTHTQDFKDVDGDRQINRSTVPLDNPRVARPSILLFLMGWSILLSRVWKLDIITTGALCTLGGHVGMRFLTKDGRHNDQVSFYWYNVSNSGTQFPLDSTADIINSSGSLSPTHCLGGIALKWYNNFISAVRI
jgi:4-hydroxybenzoate polyprenyltransferase